MCGGCGESQGGKDGYSRWPGTVCRCRRVLRGLAVRQAAPLPSPIKRPRVLVGPGARRQLPRRDAAGVGAVIVCVCASAACSARAHLELSPAGAPYRYGGVECRPQHVTAGAECGLVRPSGCRHNDIAASDRRRSVLTVATLRCSVRSKLQSGMALTSEARAATGASTGTHHSCGAIRSGRYWCQA